MTNRRLSQIVTFRLSAAFFAAHPASIGDMSFLDFLLKSPTRARKREGAESCTPAPQLQKMPPGLI